VNRTGTDFDRHVVERDVRTEMLGHGDGFERQSFPFTSVASVQGAGYSRLNSHGSTLESKQVTKQFDPRVAE
jgi:hypothetical protein